MHTKKKRLQEEQMLCCHFKTLNIRNRTFSFMLGLSYKHKNGSRSLNSIGTNKVNRDITHNAGKNQA